MKRKSPGPRRRSNSQPLRSECVPGIAVSNLAACAGANRIESSSRGTFQPVAKPEEEKSDCLPTVLVCFQLHEPSDNGFL